MRRSAALAALLALLALLALTAGLAACTFGPSTGPGGAEGEGEGEGGGPGEGEGEGEAPSIAYEFETADGTPVAGDALDLGSKDASQGPFDVDLRLKNTGATDFAILSDPPLLVAGTDAQLFSVKVQPPDVVQAGQSVPFTITYAPATAGRHEGKFLFAWGEATDERVVLTVDATATGIGHGVQYALYSGAFDVLPDFSTLTPAETGTVHNFDISERAGSDDFAFDFTGAIVADADGSYTFFTTSDDGSRLLVDGAVVVDNDGAHGAVEQSGTVDLTAGPHAVEVQYFENAGDESLVVEWQGPGFTREAVPDDHLLTAAP